MQLRPIALCLLLLLPAASRAQKHKNDRDSTDSSQRATVLGPAKMYVTADTSAPPILTITPGHEIVISARNGDWINIFANTDAKEDSDPDAKPEFEDPEHTTAPSSGWIRNKGIVGPATPRGDLILYGTASEFETQAEEPHAPKGSAEAAHLLYARLAEYFPQSPLAPEALFRSADVRWQLEKLDISTLPSAHEQRADLRPQIYEGDFKKLMKLYQNSPFAARAAFVLLDNKLCGDWQGLPKCPEEESQLYIKYADRYRGGPKSAEALYDAAYRQGVLVTMYKVDEQPRRAADAAKNCQSIADQLQQEYPQSDFAARALSLAFRVGQGVSVYGNDTD